MENKFNLHHKVDAKRTEIPFSMKYTSRDEDVDKDVDADEFLTYHIVVVVVLM